MMSPRISSVEVVKDGLVISYDDATCAFYHHSVFTAHLFEKRLMGPAKKIVGRSRGVSRGLKLPAASS